MNDLISRQAAIDAVKKYFKMIKLNPEILVDSLITLPSAQSSVSKTEIVGDVISRQAAIELVGDLVKGIISDSATMSMKMSPDYLLENLYKPIRQMPSAQPDRDIPKKPTETTDRAWGIPKRQAVCPNCGIYLGTVSFISENRKIKISYCESCGQVIDWKGWEDDESNKQAN